MSVRLRASASQLPLRTAQDSMAAGAVGGLRHVKTAIAAARLVMERTTHTLLVGLRASQVDPCEWGAQNYAGSGSQNHVFGAEQCFLNGQTS